MSEKKGNRAFLEALQAEKVRYIFGNPGSSEIPWLDVLPDYPDLRYVIALHEGIGVAMADGFAWASGEPGVVSLHTAPGLAHGLGNLFNASYTGAPIVALIGEQPTRLLNRDPFLGTDLLDPARNWVKWSCKLASADEIAYGVHRAFKEATDPPTGPVLLTLARDLLDEPVKEEIPHALRRSLGRKVRPDRDEVRKAAELLVQAKSPALICGPAAERAGAVPALTDLVDSLAMRVYDDSRYPSCFPTTHPHHLGIYNRDVANKLDLLLVVGQQVFMERQLRDLGLVPPNLRLIHVDFDPWVIAKNHPVDAGLYGHPRLCAEEILACVKELELENLGGRIKERANQIKQEKAVREEAKKQELAEFWDKMPISGQRVVGEMRRLLSPDAIIVDEASGSTGFLRKFFDFPEPGLNYHAIAGCLGWGLSAAMGVKLAKPDRRVVAYLGDGSLLYYPQALWTACRYRIPVVAVVCNNHSYLNDKIFLQLRGGPAAQRKHYADVDITDPDIDFLACVKSMGAYAERVERPEDLAGALERSLEKNRPAVVTVEVDPWQWGPHGG
jgi:benzoylformate decarboxylase